MAAVEGRKVVKARHMSSANKRSAGDLQDLDYVIYRIPLNTPLVWSNSFFRIRSASSKLHITRKCISSQLQARDVWHYIVWQRERIQVKLITHL